MFFQNIDVATRVYAIFRLEKHKPVPSNQIVWRQHANKNTRKCAPLTELHLWYHLESDKHVVVTHTATTYIVHNLLPQFELIPNLVGIGVIPTKSYTMLTSY